jgi:hypothetical protein
MRTMTMLKKKDASAVGPVVDPGGDQLRIRIRPNHFRFRGAGPFITDPGAIGGL